MAGRPVRTGGAAAEVRGELAALQRLDRAVRWRDPPAGVPHDSIERRVARLTAERARLDGILDRDRSRPRRRWTAAEQARPATPDGRRRRLERRGAASAGRPTPNSTGGWPGPRPSPRPSTRPGPGPAPSGWRRWPASWAPCSSWSRSTTASKRRSRRPPGRPWPRWSSTVSAPLAAGLDELQRAGVGRRGRGPARARLERGPADRRRRPVAARPSAHSRCWRRPAWLRTRVRSRLPRRRAAWLDRLLAGTVVVDGGWEAAVDLAVAHPDLVVVTRAATAAPRGCGSSAPGAAGAPAPPSRRPAAGRRGGRPGEAARGHRTGRTPRRAAAAARTQHDGAARAVRGQHLAPPGRRRRPAARRRRAGRGDQRASRRRPPSGRSWPAGWSGIEPACPSWRPSCPASRRRPRPRPTGRRPNGRPVTPGPAHGRPGRPAPGPGGAGRRPRRTPGDDDAGAWTEVEDRLRRNVAERDEAAARAPGTAARRGGHRAAGRPGRRPARPSSTRSSPACAPPAGLEAEAAQARTERLEQLRRQRGDRRAAAGRDPRTHQPGRTGRAPRPASAWRVSPKPSGGISTASPKRCGGRTARPCRPGPAPPAGAASWSGSCG